MIYNFFSTHRILLKLILVVHIRLKHIQKKISGHRTIKKKSYQIGKFGKKYHLITFFLIDQIVSNFYLI